MHHWGPKQLEAGEGYKMRRQPNNTFDANAIAVEGIKDGRTRGYIQRDHAFVRAKLQDLGLSDTWRLKAKEEVVVLNRRTGPQQRCGIGCKNPDERKLEHAKTILKYHRFQFEIKHS